MDIGVDTIQMSMNIPECISMAQYSRQLHRMSTYRNLENISLYIDQKLKTR